MTATGVEPTPVPGAGPLVAVPVLESTVETLRAAGCVFAEDEARLLLAGAAGPQALAESLRRRASGVPLEVVLGWAEFRSLRIVVAPGVFVPRRRSEFLVDEAVRLGRPGMTVVDLCCGTGALGVAVATALGTVELYATDIDPAAVRCARRNVTPVGGEVLQGDLHESLPVDLRGRVDLLLVNAPYVPTEQMATLPREARDHEPAHALDGGVDGVDVHRRVAAGTGSWLAPRGHVLIETSTSQAPSTRAAMEHHGLRCRVLEDGDEETAIVVGTPAVSS